MRSGEVVLKLISRKGQFVDFKEPLNAPEIILNKYVGYSHFAYSHFAFSRKELIIAYYMYIFSLDCQYSGQGCHAEPIACKLEAKDQSSSGPRPLGYEMPVTYVKGIN